MPDFFQHRSVHSLDMPPTLNRQSETTAAREDKEDTAADEK